MLLVPAPRPIPLRAWLLLAVLLCTRLIASLLVFRANPEIIPARESSVFQPGQPFLDRVLLLSFMASFAGIISLASADGFRLHLLGSISRLVSGVGLPLFAFGWAIAAWAVAANGFALTVVRPQDGQVVVTAGPYRHVRHPIYLGAALVMAGECLWLRSPMALVASALPMAILVARIHLEERFLTEHTPGYGDYAVRVPFRLLPGVW